MISPLLSQAFFGQMKHHLLKDADWSVYSDNTKWTTTALDAIRACCGRFTTYTQREYLNLDLVGYDRVNNGAGYRRDNWRIRIAIEHENDANSWSYELCKLTDVVADLRVLVTYAELGKVDPQTKLQSAIAPIQDRLLEGHTSAWLFVFGPWRRSQEPYFQAFTFDTNGEIIRIPDADPLYLPSNVA
jgi:hypothetical protein